ncbi:MAG: hypothetical protein EOL97_09070 [Spirochaetia bacterium]|nr:hypothetical protein [Spirochaetia bacterium]
MGNEVRLFSYKIANDTGFAPNPFHNVLSLATCKPGIRKSKKEGDWIAGFSSKALIYNYNKSKSHPKRTFKSEELIYLMKIDKIITYKEYWESDEYNLKKYSSDTLIQKNGDNIYKPTINFDMNNIDLCSSYEQIKNSYHDEKNKSRDISGKYVLISNTFYYFGINSILLDSSISPKIPKTQSYYGIRTHDKKQAIRFINYIQDKYEIGIQGHPTLWPNDDTSWRRYESNIK